MFFSKRFLPDHEDPKDTDFIPGPGCHKGLTCHGDVGTVIDWDAMGSTPSYYLDYPHQNERCEPFWYEEQPPSPPRHLVDLSSNKTSTLPNDRLTASGDAIFCTKHPLVRPTQRVSP